MINRTKIVATIGPETVAPEAIKKLHECGASVARLNGSHSDIAWHASAIKAIRSAVPEMPILLDIPGRKIRTVQLSHEPEFVRGDVITLTTESGHDGSSKVPVNYAELHNDVTPGAVVYADDGTLRFTVTEVRGNDILCRAENDGILRSRKGINVPFVKLKTRLVTDRDREMVAFAKECGVDFIGISFVESAAHVEAIRELTMGNWPRIVAKIENRGGLENMNEIIEASDVIMIDRGDLSVETNLENTSVAQKQIIECARTHATPVIVATEMLHTMISNPFPTKAEISDITNSVLDGCAATMLSGETAVGKFPFEAVSTMNRVTTAAEAHLQSRLGQPSKDKISIPQAVGQALSVLCRSLPITKIVAVSVSGYAARMVAAYSPDQPILAVSNDAIAARSFNLILGTTGVHVDVPFSRTSTDHIAGCLKALWGRGLIEDDDMILVTAVGYPRSGNRMNLIETHVVSDLVMALGWERSVKTP